MIVVIDSFCWNKIWTCLVTGYRRMWMFLCYEHILTIVCTCDESIVRTLTALIRLFVNMWSDWAFFCWTFVKSDFYFACRDRNYIIMYRSQQWQFEIFSRSHGNSVIANASNAITWIKSSVRRTPFLKSSW